MIYAIIYKSKYTRCKIQLENIIDFEYMSLKSNGKRQSN